MKNSRQVSLEIGQRIPYLLQEGTIGRVLGSMLEKVGDAPLGGLFRFGPPNPAQKFFDTVGLGGSQALLDEFQQSALSILNASFFSTFEHGPSSVVRELCLPGLKLSDVIDGLGETLDDMEPVDSHRGGLELLFNGREERWRHVKDNFGDVLKMPIMGFDERAEGIPCPCLELQRSLANRTPIQVDEDSYVVMATL